MIGKTTRDREGVGGSADKHGWVSLGAREYMVPDPQYGLQRPRIEPLSVHLPLAGRKAKGVGGWSMGFRKGSDSLIVMVDFDGRKRVEDISFHHVPIWLHALGAGHDQPQTN
jgi:hypothetical protein